MNEQDVERREPDPFADIAETIGGVHGCDNPRNCAECREAAGAIWRSSPGHREAWFNRQQAKLAEAIKDVCWRATQYGQTDDGDTFAYLVTKGAMHRLIGAAQGAGISASFRADSSKTLPDADAVAAARADGRESLAGEIRALATEWESEGASLVKHAHGARDVHEGTTMRQNASALRALVAPTGHDGETGEAG